MPAHVTELRARWSDIDAAGIAYYPHVFRWFDLGAEELFRALELPWSALFPDSGIVGTPILEAHCRFLSPIRYDDRLRIESRVEEVREKAIRVAHRVFGQGPGDEAVQLCAESYEVRGWVGLASGGTPILTIPLPLPNPGEREFAVVLLRGDVELHRTEWRPLFRQPERRATP